MSSWPCPVPAGREHPRQEVLPVSRLAEKYFVTYFAVGNRGSVTGVTINHKVSRRHHHGFGEQLRSI